MLPREHDDVDQHVPDGGQAPPVLVVARVRAARAVRVPRVAERGLHGRLPPAAVDRVRCGGDDARAGVDPGAQLNGVRRDVLLLRGACRQAEAHAGGAVNEVGRVKPVAGRLVRRLAGGEVEVPVPRRDEHLPRRRVGVPHPVGDRDRVGGGRHLGGRENQFARCRGDGDLAALRSGVGVVLDGVANVDLRVAGHRGNRNLRRGHARLDRAPAEDVPPGRGGGDLLVLLQPPVDGGERTGRALTASHPEPGERRGDDRPVPQLVERRQDVLVLDQAVVPGIGHLRLHAVRPATGPGRGQRRHRRAVGVLERQRRRARGRACNADGHHDRGTVGVTQLDSADEAERMRAVLRVADVIRRPERRPRVVRHG